MKKRGQVTLFILIGVVLLIGLLLTIFLVVRQDRIEEARTEITHIDTFPQFVESCITKGITPLLYKIGDNGGTLKATSFRLFQGKHYRYLCMKQPGLHKCVHRPLFRDIMESELEDALAGYLDQCISVETYEKQGFIVTDKEKEVDVQINRDDVRVTLTYPVTFEKKGIEKSFERYAASLQMPLGKLLEYTIMLINQELGKGHVDVVPLMKDTNVDVLIEKHKPYPDIVYHLRDDDPTRQSYNFRFALQGTDTVSLIGKQSPSSTLSTGSCTNEQDNLCYEGTVAGFCGGTGRTFGSDKCAQMVQPRAATCSGGQCKNCGEHRHGESWCVFDGPAGSGLDLVGSRHYVYSCVDGIMRMEECRDYREELCVSSGTNARCRPNRWQDCALQSSEGECMNKDERDCAWTSWREGFLKRSNACYPEVPPGFRIWEQGMQPVCQMANTKRICDDVSCPLAWVEAAEEYCFKMGDCGGYYNVLGQFSEGGNFNSDVHISGRDKPRAYIYPSLATGYRMGSLGLPFTISSLPGTQLYTPDHTIPDIMQSAREYKQQAEKWKRNRKKLMWEYITEGEVDIWILAANVCNTWKMPYGGSNCAFCEQDSNKPCTPYRCKSLGIDCFYSEENGFGKCTNYNANDKTGPLITIDEAYLRDQGFKINPVFYTFAGEGLALSPAQVPNRLFSLKFETSEPSQCYISPAPQNYALQLPETLGVSAGETEFSTNHTIPVTIIDTQLINGTLDAFNLSGPAESSRYLDFSNQDVDVLNKIFGYEIDSFISGADNVFTKSFNAFLTQTAIFLDQEKVLMYVHCRDPAGNINQNKIFVSYVVDRNKVDNLPPVVLGSSPSTPTLIDYDSFNLHLYLDKPSDCRYSTVNQPFESMNNAFDCTTSSFFVSNRFGGSYPCETQLAFEGEPALSIYIKCADNPVPTFRYKSFFKKGTEVKNTTSSVIQQDLAVLDNNEFVIPDDTFSIETNVSENVSCKYGTEDAVFLALPDEFMCSGGLCRTKELSFLPDNDALTVYVVCKEEGTSLGQHVSKTPFIFRATKHS